MIRINEINILHIWKDGSDWGMDLEMDLLIKLILHFQLWDLILGPHYQFLQQFIIFIQLGISF